MKFCNIEKIILTQEEADLLLKTKDLLNAIYEESEQEEVFLVAEKGRDAIKELIRDGHPIIQNSYIMTTEENPIEI